MQNLILDQFPPFLDKLLENINKFGIDVSKYELDHVAWYASSSENYDKLIPKFKEFSEMTREAIVGGRRVGIFKLNEPMQYKSYSILAIELIENKPDQVITSGPEHAEFVIDVTFEEFLAMYPDVKFNESAVYREEFPMIILKLEDHMQVKFHLENVLEME